MWSSIRLIAAKDLRIEWRSRMLLLQVLPFGAVVLMIFAYALDAKAVRFEETPGGTTRSVGLLPLVAPGLIWLVVLFAVVMLVQRAFAIESEDGAIDALRLAGISPVGVYWGKTIALACQLIAFVSVVVVLGLVFYGASLRPSGFVMLVVTVLLATIALAAVGALYGAFTLRGGGAVLLPLLVFPATAPVILGATRATESAFGTDGLALSEGWPWIGLLVVYTVALGFFSSIAFGPLTEEAI